MKLLKRILQTLLIFILLNLIVIYILSINIESLIINNIVKEVLQESIINTNIEELLPIENSKEALTKILENDSTQEILQNYSYNIINNLSVDNEKIAFNVEEDLIKIINDNKKEIEESIGTTQTNLIIANLHELKIHNVLSKQIDNSIESTKNTLPKEARVVLKIYNIIKSNDFQNTLIIVLIITTILLFLTSESISKVIRFIATDLLLSGVSIALIITIANQIIKNRFNIVLLLTQTNLFKTGKLLIIIGIITLIISIIIEMILRKRKIKNQN